MSHRLPQNPARHAERVAIRKTARVRLSAVALFALSMLILSGWARGADSEADRLARILKLRPGASVADVGAGSGDMSIAMATRVAPGGTVYSTEIDPKLLDKIRAAVKKAGLRNVVVITAKQHDTELPSNSCDAIFLREVYHHLVDPVAIDKSLFRAMRPGGRLAIIDFDPIPGEPAAPGVPASHGKFHGVAKQIVDREVTRSGFRLVSIGDWPAKGPEKLYCILFSKPRPGMQSESR
jgi:ubiquinone/menaquinone biosynthesis C-methylase UbiE